MLTQHASVKQAVVLARATESTANEDTQADKRLLAYVVLHRDAASTSTGHGAVTPETLR